MRVVPMLMVCAVVGCGHATETRKPAEAAPAAAPKRSSIATSKTTKQMFKRDGVKKLQEALGARGYSASWSGTLDFPTQRALRKFQESEGIAATGFPDYESVRRLGLEPDEVFHHRPPAERVG